MYDPYAGTGMKIAERFGVPLTTAYRWIRVARQRGYIPEGRRPVTDRRIASLAAEVGLIGADWNCGAASMPKRDPVAEYIAAHPERAHQGKPPPVPVARARAVAAGREAAERGVYQGHCSVTGRPVFGAVELHRHGKRDHPERPGCRVEVRVVEGEDGRYHVDMDPRK